MEKIIKKSVGEAIYKDYLPFENGWYELVYLGQDGKSFHIGYRVYSSSSEKLDVKIKENFIYQIPQSYPTEISFKNKVFSVFKVSNKTIAFKLLSLEEDGK